MNQSQLRYHLTFVIKAVVQKTRDNKYWQQCGEKESVYTVGGNTTGIVSLENSMEFPPQN